MYKEEGLQLKAVGAFSLENRCAAVPEASGYSRRSGLPQDFVRNSL
jgi:hypothetical protein